jgi:hypothetical protein
MRSLQCLYSVLCTEWEYCAAALTPYSLEKQKEARLSHICTVNGVHRFYLLGKVKLNSKTIYIFRKDTSRFARVRLQSLQNLLI